MILALALTAVMHAQNVITVHAVDFVFHGPQSVSAGAVTIRMVNDGKEIHMVGITRINRDHTIPDLINAINANKPAPWAVDMGGANAVAPGDTSNATVILEPGNYALACWVISKDMKLHAQKGMIVALEVTGPAVKATLPKGDVAITLSDYKVAMPLKIKSGQHRFAVFNAGKEAHDIQIFRLEKDGTMKDVEAWFDDPAAGSTRARPMGGVVGFRPNHRAVFDANLPAGSYIFLCWIPDEKGAPHFRGHRMYIKVQVL